MSIKPNKNLSVILISVLGFLIVLSVFGYDYWKNKEEIDEHIKHDKNDIAEELADVMYWVLLMSHDLKIDIIEALEMKIRKNEKKYPVSKSKGKHTKYNKL